MVTANSYNSTSNTYRKLIINIGNYNSLHTTPISPDANTPPWKFITIM